MKTTISREFKFDSAHNLVHYKGKCENLHGHTYRLRVTLAGSTDADSGMIMDFGIIKQIVEDKVIDKLDHHYINDFVENSTAENIIRWIWNELKGPLSGETYHLYELKLWETENSFVTLREE
jgi:6-pyruvoyltetrahydropterin/6-carboxytetrahydropterin synthase